MFDRFFRRIFGQPESSSSESSHLSASSPSDPASTAEASPSPAMEEKTIQFYDSFGREMVFTRQEWLDQVLKSSVQDSWNDEEKLSRIVVHALSESFYAEILPAAERLKEIDTNFERSTVLLAVAYLKMGRLDEAESLLRTYLALHGDSGVVLTNLAKVLAAKHLDEAVEPTLWRGLEVDPNQDNAIQWYEAIHREKSAGSEIVAALQRVAALPGSWRAQLWLARHDLEIGELDHAMERYQNCLHQLSPTVPGDLLVQMSGDLGNFGHIPELINLTEPYFSAHQHGIVVGGNLIHANIDLGQIDEARRILNQLYAEKRPDWSRQLSQWNTEIARLHVETEQVDTQVPLEITILAIPGPVWWHPDSPSSELFPVRQKNGPSICFLCATVSNPEHESKAPLQLTDAPGRISRALPLFLAEQLHWKSNAEMMTLVPWVMKPHGGFVVSSQRWQPEEVIEISRQADFPHDYIVNSHFEVVGNEWTVEFSLLQSLDGMEVGKFSKIFQIEQIAIAIPEIEKELTELLQRETELHLQNSPRNYRIPAVSLLPHYLVGLEQCLALRCATLENTRRDFLNNERDIIDSNIQLCLASPSSVSNRILLAQILEYMQVVRPEILAEYQEKISLLQKQNPLPGAAGGVLERIFHDIGLTT